MTGVELAQTIADRLGLLDGARQLVVLDSLMIVDFVTQLESDTGLVVPTAELTEKSFGSLEDIAALLKRIGYGA